MKMILSALAAAATLLTGCESNVNYRAADFSGDKVYAKKRGTTPQLRENEVLGLRATRAVKDSDIGRILDEANTLQLKEGSTILLVQSGVASPDKEMIDELSKRFVVVPHTGIPAEIKSGNDEDVSKALR